MSKEHLIQYQDRSPQEAHEENTENGRKGGIISGERRREKKRMREWAEVLGAMPTKITAPDGEEIDADNFAAVVNAQIEKAKKGDTQAAKFIAELMGEMEQNINLGTEEGRDLGFRIVDTRLRDGTILDTTPKVWDDSKNE